MRISPSSSPFGDLPSALLDLIAGYSPTRITEGCSGAEVFRLTREEAPPLYLKTNHHPAGDSLADERARIEWLHGRLPVPVIHCFITDHGNEYLLLSEVPGVPASDRSHEGKIEALVRLLADGLRMLHRIDIEACPFDERVERQIEKAERRVNQGVVDEEDFDDARRGRTARQLFGELLATRPADEDLVFTHGDFCLPNVIIDRNRIGGFVDLGRAGIGDRYRDLALAARSLAYNFGPEHVKLLFEAYGIGEPDRKKLEYHMLLDEFF
jgi:aminoglycoside phosphotransferase